MSDSALVLGDAENAARRAAWARARAPWVFAGVMLLSATLVFSLQPMFAKMVLPRVGGGAAAWTVALVFFQGALLIGYGYAHHLSSRLALKHQIGAHLGVLALSAFFLPIAVASGFDAPPREGQGLWLIGLYTASVGLPFAAASATAPLLQSWFARTGRADAGDPYYLYGASNIGSFVALLAFPLLIEPALGASAQAHVWTIGFALLAIGIVACAWVTLSTRAVDAPAQAAGAVETWRQRALWTALGLLPSALLVAATTHITTDVASAPLLWVIPLALYLSAFIVAFAKRAWVSQRAMTIVFPALAAAALALGWTAGDWRVLSLVTLGALWAGCYVCCRALYDVRPQSGLLTSFYLWMSLGGVIGGALSALVAPLVFDTVLEWHIAVALCLLALPLTQRPSRAMLAIFALCLSVTLVAAAGAHLGAPNGRLIAAGLGAGLCAFLLGRNNRLMMAAAGAALILMGSAVQSAGVLFANRSFYGAVRVLDTHDGQWRKFAHGTTLHGVQSLDPARANIPAGYYGPQTPIGLAMAALDATGRVHNVGILGLGIGAMACHARPGQAWTFYEIDPLVVRVAQDRQLFTFLSRCAPNAPVIVGDARLELMKQPAGAYDVLLADAFSSDSVPTHLITREAMALYLSRVSENGVVLIHVSNRNLALADVASRAAIAAGAVVLHRRSLPTHADYANFGSEVIAIAKSRAALAPLMTAGGWDVAAPPPGRVWTDDYSNILEPLVQRLTEQSAP